ncbi:MAG: hypothetical protein ACRD1T_28135 [Acidimicrobiia bacterium]
MHQIFHVVALVAFLTALGVAFLGVTAPLMFPSQDSQESIRLPALKGSVLLAVAAGAGLGADWLIHNL